MNNPLLGPYLFNTNRRTGMTKLIVAFLYVSNAPKKCTKLTLLWVKNPIKITPMLP